MDLYRYETGPLKMNKPRTYINDDVVHRNPLLISPHYPEPPISVITPLIPGKNELNKYCFYVGKTLHGIPFHYCIDKVVSPLLFVVATTGGGKTTTMFRIVRSVLEQVIDNGLDTTVIVIDPENEYAKLIQTLGIEDVSYELRLGAGDYINILERPNRLIDPKIWYARTLSIVLYFLKLSRSTPQAIRALKKVLNTVIQSRKFTDDPKTWLKPDVTLEDIYKEVENQLNTLQNLEKKREIEQREIQGLTTLATRLGEWIYPPYDTIMKNSSFPLWNMFNYRFVIFGTRELPSALHGLISRWLVHWLFGYLLSLGPLPSFGLRFVLVIDEAWALTQKKKEGENEGNPIETAARRIRKYGGALFISTQTPEDVDPKMFSLFGTLAVGVIPSEKMVKLILESRGLPAEQFNQLIKMMPRGRFLWSILWNRRDFPFSKSPIIVDTSYPLDPMVQIVNTPIV